MEETENPEILDISEPTEGEQKEDAEGQITPVIGEENNSEEQEQTPDVEEEPKETPDVEEEPNVEENPSALNSEIQSADVAETGISYAFYKESVSEENKIPDAAKFTYLDGVNKDNNKTLNEGRAVKFRLDELNPGWKKNDVVVEYKIGEKTTTSINPKDGVYTIPLDVDAVTTGDNPAPEKYSGDVAITVTVKAVRSTLKIDNSSDLKNVSAWLTKKDDAGELVRDTAKKIEAAGQILTYAESEQPVTIAVEGLSGVRDKVSVYVTGEASVPAEEGDPITEGEGQTEKEYRTFTFTPSALSGFDSGADNEVNLSFAAGEEAKTLSTAIDNEQAAWKLSTVENLPKSTEKKTYITVGELYGEVVFVGKDADGEDAVYSVDEDHMEGKILAFKADPVGNYKFRDAENKGNQAKATLRGYSQKVYDYKDIKEISASYVEATGTGTSAIPAHYEINLGEKFSTDDFAGYDDLTIHVWADVVPDDTKEGVHTVTFAGDGMDTVSLYYNDGMDYRNLQNPYTAETDSLDFYIKPDSGYALKTGRTYGSEAFQQPVVKAKYEKVYKLTLKDAAKTKEQYVAYKDGTVPVVVAVDGEEWILTENEIWTDDGYITVYGYDLGFENPTGDEAWKNGTIKGTDTAITAEDFVAGRAAYSIENTTVTVETEIPATRGGKVTVMSSGIDYKVTGDEGVTPSGTDENAYTVSNKAKVLQMEITSERKPVLRANGGDGYYEDVDLHVEKGEGGKWLAEIPVWKLPGFSDEETAEPEAIIHIEYAPANGTIAISGLKGRVKVNDGDWQEIKKLDDYGTSGIEVRDVAYEEEIALAFEEADGYKIAGVSLDDTPVSFTRDAENNKVVSIPKFLFTNNNIEITMHGDITAFVKAGEDLHDPEKEDENAYVIPDGDGPITISLWREVVDDSGEVGEAVNILYAKLYDLDAGGEIAATTASVDGDTATIDRISDKDGKIRVDLTAEDKTTVSVQIREEKLTEALEVQDAKKKSVTAVALAADTEAEYTVAAKRDDKGNLDFAQGVIGYEVVDAADADGVNGALTSNKYVSAGYDTETHKLTITALPALPAKEGEERTAYVRLYNRDKRAAALADKNAAKEDKIALMADPIAVTVNDPTIIGQKPTVKELTGTDKKLKIELSTTDKVLRPVSGNMVYYKVTVNKSVTVNGNSVPQQVKEVYIPKNAWGKSTQPEEIVVDETPGEVSVAQEYSLKVSLVQTTAGKTPEAEAAANPKTLVEEENKIAELKKISTRASVYETKLKMRPTSVTVYTGQGLDTTPQTQAQFDKKTGYTTVPFVQFVNTKTGVLMGTSSQSTGTAYAEVKVNDEQYNWTAKVDENSGYVTIGVKGSAAAAKDLPKDIGLKVTAMSPDGAYASTAIVKITVANGIRNIKFVNGTDRSIYKETNKKATLKLTPILNYGVKDKTPKSKTLTYAMGDGAGRLPGEDGYEINPEVASMVKVDPKNGTITVDKDYDLRKGDGGYFSVVARAADYTGNIPGYSEEYQEGRRATVHVRITGEAQKISKENIVIVRNRLDNVVGDYVYDVVKKGDCTLNAEDFDGNGLCVKVLKEGVTNKTTYEWDDFVNGVSVTSAKKASLAVDGEGWLDFIKPEKNAIKLTVAAGDGSKGKADINVTLKGYSKLGLYIDGEEGGNDCDPNTAAVEYDGTMNARFGLWPAVFSNNQWRGDLEYTNVKITPRNAKIVDKTKDGVSWLSIVMTAPKAEITIEDKTDKNIKRVYTIEQKPSTDLKAAAPTIKEVSKKLTAADINNAITKGTDVKLTFQVTNKKSTPENHTRQYLYLAPDYTKKAAEISRTQEYLLGQSNYMVKQIDDKGQFTLDLTNLPENIYSLNPGSCTLIATVGNYENGKFRTAAKGVAVKVTIPGKAAKNSLTVKGKYTIDKVTSAPVGLASGGNISTEYEWTLTNTPSADGNYAMNMINPSTGKPNEFNKYFEVKEDPENGFVLGLKPGQTKDTIDKITKADLDGYVTVSSYSTEYNGNKVYFQTKDMKITVAFKDSKPVAKTAKASVYKDGDKTTASVKIYETAKSTTPLKLAAAVVDDSKGNGVGAALVNATTGVESDGETLKIKLPKAESGKTYKVNLKVLMQNSAYATMTGGTNVTKVAEEHGRAVTATIKVVAKDTTKKVTVNGKALQITSDEFDPASNTYTLAVGVDSAFEGGDVKKAVVSDKMGDKATDKAFDCKAVVDETAYDEDTHQLLLRVNRAELLKATAGSSTSSWKNKLNKSVDIPVKFSFTGDGVTDETVKVKVTLPNPMTFENALKKVKNEVKGKNTILGMEGRIRLMKLDLLFDENGWSAEEDQAREDLEARIEKLISETLPADVQADVTRSIALTETKEKTGYETRIEVKKLEGDASTQNDYSDKFTFDKRGMLSAYELADVIGELTAKDLEQFGNDYTRAQLLADIWNALEKKGLMKRIPGNLKLVVDSDSWELKKATVQNDGYLDATVKIFDRQSSEYMYEANIYLEIECLGDLDKNMERIEEALQDRVNIIYADIINGNENPAEALETEILKTARKAVKNPAVQAEGLEVLGENGPKIKVDKANATNKKYKGSLEFKIKMTWEEMDGSVLLDLTGANKIVYREDTQKKLEALGMRFIAKLMAGEGMPGVNTLAYDSATKKLTATLDEAYKDEDVEKTYRAWKNSVDNDDRRKEAKAQIVEAFEGEWDELTSVTVIAKGTAKVNVGIGTLDLNEREEEKTVTKTTDMTLDEFADELYKKLDQHQEDYIQKVKDKLTSYSAPTAYKFGDLEKASGTIFITVNYGEEQPSYEMKYDVEVTGFPQTSASQK